jgi:hypothetical protein
LPAWNDHRSDKYPRAAALKTCNLSGCRPDVIAQRGKGLTELYFRVLTSRKSTISSSEGQYPRKSRGAGRAGARDPFGDHGRERKRQ